MIAAAKMIFEAAGIGADGHAPAGPKPGEFAELYYADLLAARLPPLKIADSEWYAFSDGAWQKIRRASLRPAAQEILPADIRTARHEATLLDHLEGRCQAAPEDFRGFCRLGDNGEILINAANGIVRVAANQSPELLPHGAEHLFTQRTMAQFCPQAGADLFRKILVELLPDELDRDLLQLCLGNFLLPDCRFETAVVCYGEAASGKSTIAEAASAVLGPGLVTRLSMSQICDPRSYHLPKLRYAAVNLGTELDVIAIDESANFKTIVSGEPVEARPIYGEPFTMQTGCKLWFLANALPRFKNGTEAELRRTRFLRFDQRPAVKDVTLKHRLLTERDGVFNFMLSGLQRLLTLSEIPLGGAESQAVHARFKVSNDPLGTFVAQQCLLDMDGREAKAALKSAFDSFCETHGLPEQFGDWFFKRLYERFTNLKEIRAGSTGERVRCVAGIRLKTMIETD
jgi:P4 family phage/plasmid primase-like protien